MCISPGRRQGNGWDESPEIMQYVKHLRQSDDGGSHIIGVRLISRKKE